MENRLKAMGEGAARQLLVNAAIKAAGQHGYTLKRQPGRGLSSIYEVTKNGATKVAALRTTRDRWLAFPPLEAGKQWKTLDDVGMVLVSAVDDSDNPQNVDVYLFSADEVRKRFDASYAARIENGHTVCDDFGMWVKLDYGDPSVPSQVGSGLAQDYPAIASFSIDELELGVSRAAKPIENEAPATSDREPSVAVPPLTSVADVLGFARRRIAGLTGLPESSIKLDLKMGV